MSSTLESLAARLWALAISSTTIMLTACATSTGGSTGDEVPTSTSKTASIVACQSSTITAIAEQYSTDDLGLFPQDRVLRIELSLPDADWVALHVDALAEQYVAADANIDGQEIGNIGIRFKGNNSLTSCFDEQGKQLCERLSLKLKFDECEKGKLFYGAKRLVLNSTLTEWDLFREELSYRLFRDMSIIAPRTSYAVVTVNGVSQGIYTVVEDVDGRFTSKRFAAGNGNLFKEAWPSHTDDAYYAFFLQTNTSTATFTTYESFSAEMQAATDDTSPTVLNKWMDLAYLKRYLAVDYAIANWDGITTFYCSTAGCDNHNYYMYQDETAARFTLIPWDLNATFYPSNWLGAAPAWNDTGVDCSVRNPTTVGSLVTRPSTCDPTIRALALSQAIDKSAIEQLLSNYFIVERLSAQVDASAALLQPSLAIDPFFVAALVPQAVSDLKAQIATLRTRLEQAAVQ